MIRAPEGTNTSDKEQPALLLEQDGAVAIITNNDAPINRMTLALIDELEAVLPHLAEDTSVRAIIIRGDGEENFGATCTRNWPCTRGVAQ